MPRLKVRGESGGAPGIIFDKCWCKVEPRRAKRSLKTAKKAPLGAKLGLSRQKSEPAESLRSGGNPAGGPAGGKGGMY